MTKFFIQTKTFKTIPTKTTFLVVNVNSESKK